MRTPGGPVAGVRRPVAFTRNLGSPFLAGLFFGGFGGVDTRSLTQAATIFIKKRIPSLGNRHHGLTHKSMRRIWRRSAWPAIWMTQGPHDCLPIIKMVFSLLVAVPGLGCLPGCIGGSGEATAGYGQALSDR